MSMVVQSDEEIPTVLAMDQNQGDFILGARAKELRLKGETGLVHFKKLAGKLSSQMKREYDLWYSDREGKPQILSLTDTLKHYFRLLDSGGDTHRSYFVGVPTGLENQAWIDRYKAKVKECLKASGPLEVSFIDEPSAVFEYYRSQNKLPTEAGLILVLDVGGSTFNCALVEHRGQKKDSKVHYAASEFFGGTDIDERLFIEAVAESGLEENIDETFFSSHSRDSGIFMLKSELEQIKIKLSKQGADDDEIHELKMPEGLLLATQETLLLTKGHLDQAVKFAWDKHWRQLITKVVDKYKSNSKVDEVRIDAILMAGGSSRLPDMRPWSKRVLTHYGSPEIHMPQVKSQERAVAYGIKALCEKHAAAQRGDQVSGLQRFFTGNLYVAFRNHYDEAWQCPAVNGKKNNGLVFGGGMSGDNTTFSVDLDLPLRVSGNFLMGIFAEDPLKNPGSQINIVDEACRNAGGGFLKKADLNLTIEENNQIKVVLSLKQKKKNLAPKEFEKGPYAVDGISLIEGSQYVGLDFGHSNTYLTKIIVKAEEEDGGLIPNFFMGSSGRNALKSLNKKIEHLRGHGLLSKQKIIDYTNNQIDEICYQSSKLEKENVAPPEVLTGTSSRPDSAARLRDAYLAVLDDSDEVLHYENLTYGVQAYLCQLHKKFGEGWIRDAGQFRNLNHSPSPDLKTPDGAILDDVMRNISHDYMDGDQRVTDPIWTAIKYHVAFEMAHPFVDGNGRIGRLLLDVMCLNSGLPPVIISADRRSDYITALERAGTGDTTELVLLVAQHLDRRLDEISSVEPKSNPSDVGSDYDISLKEMLIQFEGGKDPLDVILAERQQLEGDVLETAYVHAIEGFSCFESIVDERIGKIAESLSDSAFPAGFEIITRDSLSEDSFKRFKGGHQGIEFNYKTLIYRAKSALTGRHEVRKFHFYCIGDKGQASLRLRLLLEGSNDEGLVRPIDTHIALREILLSEDQYPALIADGNTVDLKQGLTLFFAGILKDSSPDR